MVVVSAAVEGSIDEVLVKRLISEAGGIPGEVYGSSTWEWQASWPSVHIQTH